MIEHMIAQKNNETAIKELTPMKAIREKCLECVNWSAKEVRECPIKTCSLWIYRSGKTGNKRPSASFRDTGCYK